jgi:hypothetical protein
MSGKALNQLTLKELRYECETRGLSTTGTKADLETRLNEFFLSQNVEPGRIRFSIKSSSATEALSDDEQGTQDLALSERAVGNPQGHHNPVAQSDPGTSHSNLLDFNASSYATDTIQTAHEQIKAIRQSARDSSKQPSLETRLSILEDCLTRHFDDSRRIAESIRRIELGIPASRSEQTEPTHQPQPSHKRTREDQQWDRIGRQSMSAPHKPPFSIAPDGYPTYNCTTRIGLTAAKSEVPRIYLVRR